MTFSSLWIEIQIICITKSHTALDKEIFFPCPWTNQLNNFSIQKTPKKETRVGSIFHHISTGSSQFQLSKHIHTHTECYWFFTRKVMARQTCDLEKFFFSIQNLIIFQTLPVVSVYHLHAQQVREEVAQNATWWLLSSTVCTT